MHHDAASRIFWLVPLNMIAPGTCTIGSTMWGPRVRRPTIQGIKFEKGSSLTRLGTRRFQIWDLGPHLLAWAPTAWNPQCRGLQSATNKPGREFWIWITHSTGCLNLIVVERLTNEGMKVSSWRTIARHSINSIRNSLLKLLRPNDLLDGKSKELLLERYWNQETSGWEKSKSRNHLVAKLETNQFLCGH